MPRLEDGSDGFQFYENGGATGCWAYGMADKKAGGAPVAFARLPTYLESTGGFALPTT